MRRNAPICRHDSQRVSRFLAALGREGGAMSTLKDMLVSAGMAAGNIASRERDRRVELEDDDGRPKPMSERAEGRLQAIVTEGGAKIAVSQTAHLGAREVAKRLSEGSLKTVFSVLAKRPASAGGSALFAIDTAREGVRLARGQIGGSEFAVRVGGNAASIVASIGGSKVGAMIGTMTMPVVGTAIGGIVGGVVGGIGGDTYGRLKMNQILRVTGVEEDETWDDEE